MRQQRTNRSQGWVKVFAVLQRGNIAILVRMILPSRDCVNYRRSFVAVSKTCDPRTYMNRRRR
jgi:hypothetical protein